MQEGCQPRTEDVTGVNVVSRPGVLTYFYVFLIPTGLIQNGTLQSIMATFF
jgi:hypothetical protein